jgi:hypothetical protein
VIAAAAPPSHADLVKVGGTGGAAGSKLSHPADDYV